MSSTLSTLFSAIVASFTIVLALLFWPLSAQAQGNPDAQYVELKPGFVTNYGEGKRLRYLKVDISVRVESNDDALLVERHIPYLRNNLVLLFNSQDEQAVNTVEGRQTLRATALEEVQKVMQEEEGNSIVSDLLFNSFIVQS